MDEQSISVVGSLANSNADLALLVLDPKGPLHSAQTRGMFCHHRQAGGQLVLLKQNLGLHVDHFHALVCCMDPEQAAEKKLHEIADGIDGVLAESFYAFRVDRERLRELEEAWIPIVAGKDVKAILLYQNCD